MNSRWHSKHLYGYNGYAVRKFQRLYREKLWNEKRKAKKYVPYATKNIFNNWFNVRMHHLAKYLKKVYHVTTCKKLDT